MNWVLVAITVVGLGALGFGAYKAGGSATFWAGLIEVIVKAAIPAIAKQMTPKELEELHAAERRGEGTQYMHDHLRKKLKPIFGSSK